MNTSTVRNQLSRLLPLSVAMASVLTLPLASCNKLGDRHVAERAAQAAPSVTMGAKTDSKREAEVAGFDREAYDRIVENAFKRVSEEPLSTFSVDVDTASYANLRRFLRNGELPPADAVRIEEMLNYFVYSYAPPAQGAAPFATHVEVNAAPWNERHRLVRIGIKGREIAHAQRPASNLVFLLDVSGSMNSPNKLPLLKRGMKLLVDQLDQRDRVSIVVYAGASGMVLPPTSAAHKPAILEALQQLEAGGSTNGGAGIELAYRVATENFVPGGVNRVILATDGDFNVGTTSRGELTRLIEDKAKSGVFLTVLGLGMGNYQDATLEQLADKGNGNYGYIDTINEARKLLVEQLGGTLVTIAKDVKLQVEFNPARVAGYRLIGYENRVLANEDFNDDAKDAGDIGAGHTVTALYEIVPGGQPVPSVKVDELKYQQPTELTKAATNGELLTLKLRYKQPAGSQSELLSLPVEDAGAGWDEASEDLRWAAAVTTFGMLLRDSRFKGSADWNGLVRMAEGALGQDPGGYRAEMLELVRRARQLASD